MAVYRGFGRAIASYFNNHTKAVVSITSSGGEEVTPKHQSDLTPHLHYGTISKSEMRIVEDE